MCGFRVPRALSRLGRGDFVTRPLPATANEPTFDYLVQPLLRYQVMEALGHGGQGHTYRAIDRVSGDNVAVKILALKGQREWKAFDLFEREIAVLKTLHHPAIPRYRDDYSSEATGDYFLVMDLVEGTPLSDRIAAKSRCDGAELRSILQQALEILEYLHSRRPPVVHRDIKPANFVRDGQGILHLVDYGGVRAALREGGGSTVIGTFGYMAPEQLHGDASPATDIYGMGATIAALATGVDAERLPRKGLRIDLESLELDAELRQVLVRMLEPDPDDRFQSVAEVRQALALPRAREGKERQDVGAGLGPSGRLGAPSPHERAVASRQMQDLARLPLPLSVLVWIMSAIASGLLVVVEVVILPLVYRLFIAREAGARRQRRAQKRARRRHRKGVPPQIEVLPDRDPDAERRFREVEAAVKHGRRTMQSLAQQTHPIHDPPDDPGAPKRRDGGS